MRWRVGVPIGRALRAANPVGLLLVEALRSSRVEPRMPVAGAHIDAQVVGAQADEVVETIITCSLCKRLQARAESERRAEEARARRRGRTGPQSSGGPAPA